MRAISKIVLKNLQLKAGDLNEPGKLDSLFEAYHKVMSNIKVYADNLSAGYSCGGCSKNKIVPSVSTVPSVSPVQAAKVLSEGELDERIEHYKKVTGIPEDVRRERLSYYTQLKQGVKMVDNYGEPVDNLFDKYAEH